MAPLDPHTSDGADDGLDPAAFLKSVRELSEKREREDEERYRKLEEEVERSRAARAARRAERARSISPEKQQQPAPRPLTVNITTTQFSARARSPEHRSPSPFVNSPQTLATTPMAADSAEGPPSPTKHIPEFSGFRSSMSSLSSIATPAKSPSTDLERSASRSATSLARSGTLSWQQRPTSMASSRPTSLASSRPTSGLQTSRSREESKPENVADGTEPTREQIAASLGARDPTWFRQTPDRGAGNAAFRRSREEETASVNAEPIRRHGLPGLSRELSTDSRSPSRPESLTPEAYSRPSSLRDSIFTSNRFSASSTSASTPQRPDLNVLVAADKPQQQASPMSEQSSSTEAERNSQSLSRTPTISTAQARISATPERPLSPTKGMGGFVQSAMLRRSDSVNKRWSAQPGAVQVSRQTSAASLRNGLISSQSMPRLDPAFSAEQETLDTTTGADASPPVLSPSTHDAFVKPAVPHHSRNRSMASNLGDDGVSSPPSGSPRRWSPNKSSWIESALTKPDTPKAVTPAKNSQPSWMADIAKAKAQRASTDLTPRPTAPQNGRESSSRPGSPLKSPLYTENAPVFSSPRSPMRTASPLRSQLDSALLNQPSNIAPKEEPTQVESLNDDSLTQTKTTTPAAAVATERIRSVSPIVDKPKSEAPPKPATTDFRSVLKPRPAPPTKEGDTPEFLAKFGQLRKTRTENYVAPDVLKANITQGKADLVNTDGPVKTLRRDELKESLLAKKDDIKRAKEEGKELPGQLHDRKAGPPSPPSKPEALAKREVLSRAGSSAKAGASSEQVSRREATPEAVTLQRHLRGKSVSAKEPPKLADGPVAKKGETPVEDSMAQNSKLASRFNPGLAQILARGPPSSNSSKAPSRVTSPATEDVTSGVAEDGTLQDMRKGRAKGPKKRKQGGATTQPATEGSAAEKSSLDARPLANDVGTDRVASPQDATPITGEAPKRTSHPRPAQGSMASVMWASLGAKSSQHTQEDPIEEQRAPKVSASNDVEVAVPEFQGFGKGSSPRTSEENKENGGTAAPAKSVAARWSRQPQLATPVSTPKVQVPSRKDEEAAMRSASLLASSPSRTSPTRSTPSKAAPIRPAKSSRVVSGQLQEASPNKGFSSVELDTEAEKLLSDTLGCIPLLAGPLSLDVSATRSATHPDSSDEMSAGRKSVHDVDPDGTSKALPPQEDYTLFDEAVYVCQHHPSGSAGSRKPQIFIWTGSSASSASQDHAQAMARKMAREIGAAATHEVKQGRETAGFLHAMGGILVTRRGRRQGASKRYMLCGRKHLGHVVFDEVDVGPQSLLSGYVYLISQPVTLQQTKLYLWKGSACSSEEISGARLASMDLSETGEIIEVDDGAEFPSFLRVFGDDTKKTALPAESEFWRQKSLAPSKFEVRLFKVQRQQTRLNLITSLWSRRPSWNSLSPSRTISPARTGEDVKVEAQIVRFFTQDDLDADSIYVLDAWSQLYVILGPLFGSQAEPLRSRLLSEAVQFTEEYASLAASKEGRPSRPNTLVLFSGTPALFAAIFRQWDAGRGLWATGELMSGTRSGEAKVVPCAEVLLAMSRTDG